MLKLACNTLAAFVTGFLTSFTCFVLFPVLFAKLGLYGSIGLIICGVVVYIALENKFAHDVFFRERPVVRLVTLCVLTGVSYALYLFSGGALASGVTLAVVNVVGGMLLYIGSSNLMPVCGIKSFFTYMLLLLSALFGFLSCVTVYL